MTNTNILVDTHVLIWLAWHPEQLGINARETLENGTNQVFASYFSLFEMAIKAGKGKLPYDDSLIDDLPGMQVGLLMPDRQHLAAYKIHNAANKDPYDNVLLSVAQVERCVLMTSDEMMLKTAVRGVKLINAKE